MKLKYTFLFRMSLPVVLFDALITRVGKSYDQDSRPKLWNLGAGLLSKCNGLTFSFYVSLI